MFCQWIATVLSCESDSSLTRFKILHKYTLASSPSDGEVDFAFTPSTCYFSDLKMADLWIYVVCSEDPRIVTGGAFKYANIPQATHLKSCINLIFKIQLGALKE